ncbi:zinc finger protein 39-like isoform X5 [Onychomys torridus]|uniref:zinc finger protein 39-like isoform X5 n=1 Tax=Onychomys torridus TaxID=38674 RepID=UPI00167F5FBC|nr:zinc finger protein 39-like isoform X5 [Onychomys torridus]
MLLLPMHQPDGSMYIVFHRHNFRNLQQDCVENSMSQLPSQTLDIGKQKRGYKKRPVTYSHRRWPQRCRARKHKAPVKICSG